MILLKFFCPQFGAVVPFNDFRFYILLYLILNLDDMCNLKVFQQIFLLFRFIIFVCVRGGVEVTVDTSYNPRVAVGSLMLGL